MGTCETCSYFAVYPQFVILDESFNGYCTYWCWNRCKDEYDDNFKYCHAGCKHHMPVPYDFYCKAYENRFQS